MVPGKYFFLGLIIAFLGLEKLIFSTLWWFPKLRGAPQFLETIFLGSDQLLQFPDIEGLLQFPDIEGRPSISGN